MREVPGSTPGQAHAQFFFNCIVPFLVSLYPRNSIYSFSIYCVYSAFTLNVASWTRRLFGTRSLLELLFSFSILFYFFVIFTDINRLVISAQTLGAAGPVGALGPARTLGPTGTLGKAGILLTLGTAGTLQTHRTAGTLGKLARALPVPKTYAERNTKPFSFLFF